MLNTNLQKQFKNLNIHSVFRRNYKTVIYPGDCLEVVAKLSSKS